jgi:hypothetical protein
VFILVVSRLDKWYIHEATRKIQIIWRDSRANASAESIALAGHCKVMYNDEADYDVTPDAYCNHEALCHERHSR